jgi:phenylalanyl-tRNA synthetase beta subunit
VTFRLTVAAPDHTLASEEIAAIRARVIDAVQAAGHTLRG